MMIFSKEFVDAFNLQVERKLSSWSCLGRHINIFRGEARAVFGSFQAPCVATSKWRALRHRVEAWQQTESIEHSDAGWFESSYKRFKTGTGLRQALST